MEWLGHIATTAGVMVVIWSISMRQSRTDDREAELDKLRNDQKVADFWGLDSSAEKIQLSEEIGRQRNARKNWSFEVRNWSVITIGVLLFFGGRMLKEKPILGEDDWVFIAIGFAWYWSYKFAKVLSKLERAISWQEQMLRSVKDRAEDMRKESIDEYLELKEKLEAL